MENQHRAALMYILRWLEAEGFSASKWDLESEDGNWLMQTIPDVLAGSCLHCFEPALQRAVAILQQQQIWSPVQSEVIQFYLSRR